MILIDSNTLIYYIRGIEAVIKRFQATPRSQLWIPSIVAYEIEYGALKNGSPHRRKITEELLAGVAQIPFDADAAGQTARIRIDLENRGMVIGPLDLMIAGTAMSREALLVTNNTKEFSRIQGLRLADWTS